MKWVVPGVLVLVGLLHLLPLLGVLGRGQLLQLYGVPITDPSLELAMRHRAVLFGLLGGFLLIAALRPGWHAAALLAGTVSVASFLLLAALIPGINEAMLRVARLDWIALVLLAAAWVAHLRAPARLAVAS